LPDSGTLVLAFAPRPEDLALEPVELLNLLVPGQTSLLPVRVETGEDGLVAALDDGDGASPRVSLGSLLHERLESFRRKGFTQTDLDRARAAWFARRSLDSLHPEAQMDRTLAEALGRGVDEGRMKALTLSALNAALQIWLDPARLRIGALGGSGGLLAGPRP
jgi:hypothetical protein